MAYPLYAQDQESPPELRLASTITRLPEGETMPASLDRIRESMTVQPTPRDKGLQLTLSLVAYDNGMIQLDGIPINVAPDYGNGEGWLGAAEVAIATINEFRRQVERRRLTMPQDADTAG
jgi:hypothetical protein